MKKDIGYLSSALSYIYTHIFIGRFFIEFPGIFLVTSGGEKEGKEEGREEGEREGGRKGEREEAS